MAKGAFLKSFADEGEQNIPTTNKPQRTHAPVHARRCPVRNVIPPVRCCGSALVRGCVVLRLSVGVADPGI